MKALRVHGFEGPQQWSLDDVTAPLPGAGEVQVRICSNAISFVDLLFAKGGYQVRPQLPVIPGTEFSGVISALGPGTEAQWKLGQRVTGTSVGGSWAQYNCALQTDIALLPEGLDLGLASGLAITYATAHYALRQRARLRVGETVLVLGPAGGVGLASVQVAKALGATVVAAAPDAQKRDLARAHGADFLIDTSDPKWRDALKAQVPAGIDVVVDPVGGALFETAFRTLRWGGRHLVIGFASGEIPSLRASLSIMKGASLVGVDIRQFREFEPQAAAANLAEVVQLFAEGKLRPRAAATIPAQRWQEAMALAQDPATIGRVILDWSEETWE